MKRCAALFYADARVLIFHPLRMSRLYVYVVPIALLLSTSTANCAVCAAPKALSSKFQVHPSADDYVELGSWFGDHGQYHCASEAYQSGLKLQPDSSEIYYLLGLNFLRGGDMQAAIDPLRKSLQIDGNELKPHLLLADAYESLGQPERAREEWIAALRIDPNSTMGLHGLSRNLLAQGDYVSVLHLLGNSPQEETLIVDLAEAYDKAEMRGRATALLEDALKANPGSTELTRALISLLATQAHYEEAEKLAANLVQMHPDDREEEKLYLHVLVLNNDFELARPLGKKLLAAEPHDFEVLYLNGVIERESGEYAAARDHLLQAVALNPTHYNCRYNLGFVLAQLKDPTGARKQLEKAIALGGTEPEVHYQLAAVMRTLGDTKEANEQLQLYQRAQKASASRTLAALKVAQADKEADGGDLQKAIALYRDAIAAVPDNAMSNYKLAMALGNAGDTSGEEAALGKAVQLDPSMAIAHYQLGYLISRSGDTAKAEEQFRQAVQAAPAYVEAWISLAATLGMESRFEDAQKALASALELDPKNTEALQLQKDLAAAAPANP